MEALVFLAILVPIALLVWAIWLTIRTVRAHQELDRLNRWMARMQVELLEAKDRWKAGVAAPESKPWESADAPVATPVPIQSPAPLAETEMPTMAVIAPAPSALPSLPVAATAVAAEPPAPLPPAAPVPPPPPVAPPPPLAPPPQPPRPPLAINWEQFLGAKLFAWVGGLALFLAVVLAVKYSFERNLIPPELRVAGGFLMGVGLMVGGVMLKRKAYEVTAHSLCATATLILYGTSFAARSYYQLTSAPVTFALMVLVTVTAFTLAVRLNAMVVAVLGILGGFLTPPLVSTGVDNPLGLFGYVALLDLGLIAVALKRRWYYLVALGALGTVAMELGWVHEFYAAEKVFIAMAVFLGFDGLFLLAYAAGQKWASASRWLAGAAVALPFVTLGFVLWLLESEVIGARPGILYAFLAGADLCLLGIVVLRPALHRVHLLAGAAVFLLLLIWTNRHLTTGLLNWALAGYLGFAALHTAFPVVLHRLRPGVTPVWWGHLFPVLALGLAMLPLFKDLEVSWVLWPCILLIDLLAIGLALLTASILSIVAVLLLTACVTAFWIVKIPAELTGVPPLLLIVGGFAVFFCLVGLFAGEKLMARLESAAGDRKQEDPLAPDFLQFKGDRGQALAQIPALSAILPFLLLTMAAVRLPLLNPTPVYGLALLLLGLLLGLARLTAVDLLVPVGLVCALTLQYSWYGAHFTLEMAPVALGWTLLFTAALMIFPFLFRGVFAQRVLPWATAALSGPLHFYLVYQMVKRGFPNQMMGLLPATFAVPVVMGLIYVVRHFPADQAVRNTLLAWMGGSAMFFVTLIFPIQFERQWITIGWAMEGAALLWLFRRIPHRGLAATGVVLLVVAFVRLTLNLHVFDYHRHPAARLWNWYLYAYGLATLCLMAGARWLEPSPRRVLGVNAPPLLYTLGTILSFFLLNIEIADYFSTGPALVFRFHASLGQDMTYSIAWAVYALLLLTVGIWRRIPAARYASLALLGITVLKLFFYDLVRLSALYRVGAFLGVAIISIVASALYQRFFASAAVAARAQENQKV